MEFNLTIKIKKNHGIQPKYRDNQNEFGVVLARNYDFLSCLWKSVSKWSYLKSTLVDIFAQYINVDWLLSKLEPVVFSFLKTKRRIKDAKK